MASPYTQGALIAEAIGDAIADDQTSGSLAVGSTTKTTSQTTAVITHGLDGAPTFMLITVEDSGNGGGHYSIAANTTSVTVTLNTAAATWNVHYLLGYQA